MKIEFTANIYTARRDPDSSSRNMSPTSSRTSTTATRAIQFLAGAALCQTHHLSERQPSSLASSLVTRKPAHCTCCIIAVLPIRITHQRSYAFDPHESIVLSHPFAETERYRSHRQDSSPGSFSFTLPQTCSILCSYNNNPTRRTTRRKQAFRPSSASPSHEYSCHRTPFPSVGLLTLLGVACVPEP